MGKPTEAHLKAARRVQRYLKATPGKGLLFAAESDLNYLAYSNSDWGACVDTRQSVISYCVFLGQS